MSEEVTVQSRDWPSERVSSPTPRSWTGHHRAIILVLGTLGLMAGFAEFIAPYDYRTQHRAVINLPPMPVHFVDAQGRFHLRPFVHAITRVPGAQRRYAENTEERHPIRFFVRGEPYRLWGIIPGSRHLFGVSPESSVRFHLLGTDQLGRDVFSRLVYGSRVTLSIALASLLASLLLGLTVGGISGYFGGRIDALFMRFGELVQSIPAIFLILALRAAFPLEISYGRTVLMLVAIFALASWPEVARLVRSDVLSVAGREFVLSARAAGATDGWILRHHILPHALTPAIIQAAIIVPSFILGEAALSFLGVGVQEPQPSWGNMLAAAQDLTVLLTAWWMLIPGLAIFVTVAAFTALGDAIRDALDPRSGSRPQGWG